MKRLVSTLLGVCCVFASAEAAALDPAHRTHHYASRAWGLDDGLPQSTVLGIAQTADGYVWLGTEEGLARFDGVRFTTFDDRNASFPSNDVQDACVDGTDAVWMATRGGGVVRRDLRGTQRAFGVAEGLPDAVVYAVACEAEGVWAATERGLARIANGSVSAIARGGLGAQVILCVASDGAGGAWVGARDGAWHVTSADAQKVAVTPADEAVTAVHADSDGTAWIGGRGWLVHTRPGDVERWTKESAFCKGAITSILRDRAGSIWIACSDDALLRLRGERWERFGPEEGLVDSALTRLFEDREGSLWMGTRGGGVQRLADPRVVTLGKRDGLSGDFVWSVYADRDGDVWVGTHGGGVDRVRADGRIEVITKAEGLPDDTVYGVTQAPDGAMWFATSKGAARLEAGKVQRFTKKDGLIDDAVRSIHVTAAGTVWFGTTAGVSRLEGGRFTPLTRADGLGADRIQEIDGAPDGSVWIATEGGGLARWKEGHIDRFGKAQGLADDNVHSVTVEEDGTVWVATFHGLSRIREGRITSAGTRDGLCDDAIFTVLPAGDGTLWMATNRGLMRMPTEAFEAFAQKKTARIEGIVTFGKQDGLGSVECNGGMPAGTRDARGRLWFANLVGVLRYDPAHTAPPRATPTVLVESAQIDGVERERPIDLEAPAGTRALSFRFAAPSFVAPDQVRLRYRLLGFSPEWTDAESRRVAYYTTLSPGDYLFQVAAANANGGWSEAGASLRVHVAAHFWQTRAFTIAIVLAFGLASWGTYRLRVRSLRLRARELEARVDERTRELLERDQLIRADLSRARAFQQRTLPVLPKSDRLRFDAAYLPAEEVGGDVYDVFPLRPRTFRVFLADMTGHGIPAALRTMVLRTEYEVQKRASADPAGLISALNRRIFDHYSGLHMRCSAVCFDIHLDDESGNDAGSGARVTYANALQPPLLHVHDGEIHEVYEPGAYLGLVRDYLPTLRTLHLAPGDALVALTDGIFEQEDAAGHALGVDRLKELVLELTRKEGDPAESLVAAARAHAPAGQLGDDMTVLCVTSTGSRAPSTPENSAE